MPDLSEPRYTRPWPNEWVAGIAQGLNVVKVSLADGRVEHEVKPTDFTKWLERVGGSPREVSDRRRILADSRFADPWQCRVLTPQIFGLAGVSRTGGTGWRLHGWLEFRHDGVTVYRPKDRIATTA